jgi:hypothetical protein
VNAIRFSGCLQSLPGISGSWQNTIYFIALLTAPSFSASLGLSSISALVVAQW